MRADDYFGEESIETRVKKLIALFVSLQQQKIDAKQVIAHDDKWNDTLRWIKEK